MRHISFHNFDVKGLDTEHNFLFPAIFWMTEIKQPQANCVVIVLNIFCFHF